MVVGTWHGCGDGRAYGFDLAFFRHMEPHMGRNVGMQLSNLQLHAELWCPCRLCISTIPASPHRSV